MTRIVLGIFVWAKVSLIHCFSPQGPCDGNLSVSPFCIGAGRNFVCAPRHNLGWIAKFDDRGTVKSLYMEVPDTTGHIEGIFP